MVVVTSEDMSNFENFRREKQYLSENRVELSVKLDGDVIQLKKAEGTVATNGDEKAEEKKVDIQVAKSDLSKRTMLKLDEVSNPSPVLSRPVCLIMPVSLLHKNKKKITRSRKKILGTLKKKRKG